MNTTESERIRVQNILDAGKSIESRRKLGQFSTPYDLAEEIVRYGLEVYGGDRKDLCFLDPAIGTGAFFSALINNTEYSKAVGFEIDPHYGLPAADMWKDTNLKLFIEDFLSHSPTDEKYDFVICNPPCVRHHDIPAELKVKLCREIKERLGIVPSGLSGLYSHYVMAVDPWLKKDAVSGWLIPSEFMDVGYGKALKQYLLNKVDLIRIHRYDPNDLQFSDALVSSSVVWFKKSTPTEQDVLFTFGGTLSSPAYSKRIEKAALFDEAKWTRFPMNSVRARKSGPVLSDYFRVTRGVATGDNKFFIIDGVRIKDLGLPMDCFVPILPSPKKIKGDIVNRKDNGCPDTEDPQFLLNCELGLEEIRARYPCLWDYLKAGEGSTASRYLCSKRDIWYRQEKREPAPILYTYMTRTDGEKENNKARFILNRSSAIATNSFHLLYPTEQFYAKFGNDPRNIELAWKYLLNMSSEKICGEGRVYGGGLHKVEPRELSNVDVSGIEEYILCAHREEFSKDTLSAFRFIEAGAAQRTRSVSE